MGSLIQIFVSGNAPGKAVFRPKSEYLSEKVPLFERAQRESGVDNPANLYTELRSRWQDPEKPPWAGRKTFSFREVDAISAQLANVWRAKFMGHASFETAVFSGAYFDRTAFPGANFENAAFSGNTYFGNATFLEADFVSTAFSGNTFFRSASFSGNAIFYDAKFTGSISDFAATKAERAYDMSGTLFTRVPIFNQADFKQAPDLDQR